MSELLTIFQTLWLRIKTEEAFISKVFETDDMEQSSKIHSLPDVTVADKLSKKKTLLLELKVQDMKLHELLVEMAMGVLLT